MLETEFYPIQARDPYEHNNNNTSTIKTDQKPISKQIRKSKLSVK